MVSLKHKVTIKTKTAQEETPVAVGRSGVTLKRKQPVVANDNRTGPKPKPTTVPQTPTPVNKYSARKIVGGVAAAAAALLAGVFFFGMKDDNKGTVNDVGTTSTEQVAQAAEVNQPETTSQTDVSGGEAASEGKSASNDSQESNFSEANETSSVAGNENASESSKSKDKQSDGQSVTSLKPDPVQRVQSNQGGASSNKIVSKSAPLGEDLTENAKRVIRGDFGNGQERKDKLGSAYAEIQSKVNEMYRQRHV